MVGVYLSLKTARSSKVLLETVQLMESGFGEGQGWVLNAPQDLKTVALSNGFGLYHENKRFLSFLVKTRTN